MIDVNENSKLRKSQHLQLAAVLAGFAVVIGVLLVVVLSRDAGVATQGAVPAESVSSATVLEQAESTCDGAGVVGDDGYSMHVTTAGVGEPMYRESSPAQVDCVLQATGAPDYALGRLDGTRAIDGTQTVEWGALSASWTYSVDAGIDMTIKDETGF